MSSLIEMRVPDMGGFKDVAVIDVLVKPGDVIELETPLATLETEKAAMDVPATAAGVIEAVHIQKGAKLNAGDLVATVRASEAAASPAAASPAAETPAAAPAAPAPAAQAPVAPTPAATTPVAPASSAPAAPPPVAASAAPAPVGAPRVNDRGLAEIDEPGFARAHASPSVRKFARELGVDLARVKGTGSRERVTEEDVKAWVKQTLAGTGAPGAPAGGGGHGLPAVPVVDFAQFGPIEVKPLGRIQKISGPRLQASWVNIPHVTQFDEADITDLDSLREKLKAETATSGVKLTPLAFVMRACVRALKQFPNFNSSLDSTQQNLVLKQYCHIGFAADTPQGLLVPVVRDADRKDVYELARALAELSAKARAGKLSATEMQGASFTISSLGGIGGTAFTPIVNAPEVAILGVSRMSIRPVWNDETFVPRHLLPLSLSYDHRVIDGAAAARFTTFLAQQLADPRSLLEAVP